VKQHAHTIVKEIKESEVEELRKGLRELGDSVESGADQRFSEIPGLHFLSCCILEPTAKRRGWFLVLELSFDGSKRRFFQWMSKNKLDVINQLLSRCEGYPTEESEVAAYLLESTRAQAVYVGTPGRSRQQIQEEAGLRKRVAAVLKETAPLAISRPERWQRVVARIYAEFPELRNVPKRPLRVRFNIADPALRARLAAALRFALFAAAWAVGVVAPLFLARTMWQRVVVLAPPLVLGVWAVLVFIRLSPRGLAANMRVRVWIQGILEGVRTAAYVAPIGGLVLAAAALQLAWVARLALVTSGALLALFTVMLIAGIMFSIFGSFAAAASAVAAAALLWRFPWSIVPALAITVVALAALLTVFAVTIRRLEAKAAVQDEDDNLDHLDRVTRREYRHHQSHLAAENDIAAGTLRMRTLRSVLRWVNAFAFFWCNLGHLDKITSIHFARFIVLPGRRTLLFLSNYDDRFEDYLGAFSTVSGVTAVWGNSVGFPRPFLLIFDGARAENLFKRYARASQIESLLWFSAYPNLSVAEIDRATYLRESLARPIDRNNAGVLAALARVLYAPIDEQTLVYLMDGY
jgi:hypothetical protein